MTFIISGLILIKPALASGRKNLNNKLCGFDFIDLSCNTIISEAGPPVSQCFVFFETTFRIFYRRNILNKNEKNYCLSKTVTPGTHNNS